MATDTINNTSTPVERTAVNDTLLRNVLRGNAAFSLASGLLVLLASGPVAEFLGIAQTPILGMNASTALVLIALGVLGWAGLVYWFSRHQPIPRWQGWLTVTGDVSWVVLSTLLLLSGILPLTTAGSWAIFIVADMVLLFAIGQVIGIRRMRR